MAATIRPRAPRLVKGPRRPGPVKSSGRPLVQVPAGDRAATASALPTPLPAQPLSTTTPRAPFRPQRRSDRGLLPIGYASCLSLRTALLRARGPWDQRQPRGQRHSAIRSSLRLTPIGNARKVKGSDRSTTQAPDRHPRPTTGSDSMHLVGCLDILLKRYDASKMSAKVRARVPRRERRRAR
jgi:hypothetical protein